MSGYRGGGGALVAAAMAWAPPLALVAVRLAWASPPAVVPSHWLGDGRANAFSPSGDVFAMSLGSSAAAALVAGGIALWARDADRLKRAVVLGAADLVGCLTALVWIVASLTAVGAAEGGSMGIGAPFLLLLLAPAWGVLGGLVAGVGR